MPVSKPKPKQSLSSTLSDIARAAPGLRDAGVLAVSVGDIHATLAAAVPRVEAVPTTESDVSMGDAGAWRDRSRRNTDDS